MTSGKTTPGWKRRRRIRNEPCVRWWPPAAFHVSPPPTCHWVTPPYLSPTAASALLFGRPILYTTTTQRGWWIETCLYSARVHVCFCTGHGCVAPQAREDNVWDWRDTVEMVPFEISNSMKPYPSVIHAYTSKMKPMIGILGAEQCRWGFQPYSANLRVMSERLVGFGRSASSIVTLNSTKCGTSKPRRCAPVTSL